MTIRTLTCHNVYNYGASLQAYALQTYLKRQGHQVEIIDYKPDYLNWHYRISQFIHPESPHYTKCRQNIIYHTLYILRRYIKHLPSIKRKWSFDKFTRRTLSLTSRSYRTAAELQTNPPQADIYIVGSDQVWNSRTLLNGRDPIFYLKFGGSEIRRISYAASFGATAIPEQYKQHIYEYLLLLNSISTREASGISILKTMQIEAVQVCDPVFLLSKQEWIKQFKLCVQSTEKYILIYNLGQLDSRIITAAKYIARQHNMKIYAITTSERITGINKNISDAGPCEFINFIQQASFVISNSFHATAFSIIFGKEFLTYSFHDSEASQRMADILNILNLSSRFNNDSLNQIIEHPIPYQQIEDKLQKYINFSRQWLKRNILEKNDYEQGRP